MGWRSMLVAMLAAILLSGIAAEAEMEVELLIPDEGNWVYQAHSAAIYTPVEFPPDAVWRLRSRAMAQEQVAAAFPEDRFPAMPVAFVDTAPAVTRLKLNGRETLLIHR